MSVLQKLIQETRCFQSGQMLSSRYNTTVNEIHSVLRVLMDVDNKRNIRNRKWENMGQQADKKGMQKPC